MSELLRIYNTTNKPRPAAARVIPDQKVNFVDRENKFSVNFETFRTLRNTSFTPAALNYYDQEMADIVIPDTFVPLEEGMNLHRWSATNPYYVPGNQPG